MDEGSEVPMEIVIEVLRPLNEAWERGELTREIFIETWRKIEALDDQFIEVPGVHLVTTAW